MNARVKWHCKTAGIYMKDKDKISRKESVYWIRFRRFQRRFEQFSKYEFAISLAVGKQTSSKPDGKCGSNLVYPGGGVSEIQYVIFQQNNINPYEVCNNYIGLGIVFIL